MAKDGTHELRLPHMAIYLNPQSVIETKTPLSFMGLLARQISPSNKLWRDSP